MNLEAEILREHTRSQAERLARWIGPEKKRFGQLMGLFLHGENRVSQRSAWVLSICAEHHPELVKPYLKRMVGKMQEPGVHDAVKRNVVRILQYVDIPRGLMGEVAQVCFSFLASNTEPVAVRVFSMTVLANIAREEPDLKSEIRLLIEQHLPYEGGAFRSRARKVLKTMKRL